MSSMPEMSASPKTRRSFRSISAPKVFLKATSGLKPRSRNLSDILGPRAQDDAGLSDGRDRETDAPAVLARSSSEPVFLRYGCGIPSSYIHVRDGGAKISHALQEAVDFQPLSKTEQQKLSEILEGQFGGMADPDPYPEAPKESKASEKSRASVGFRSEDSGSRIDSRDIPEHSTELAGAMQHHKASVEISKQATGLEGLEGSKTRSIIPAIGRLVDNQYFIAYMMLWTFFALFAPDLDVRLGDEESKHTLSIVVTVVCGFFLLEIILQSIGRKNYFLRAYFWLDTIALISLLPDTWLFQAIFQSNEAFVAGRSSRLTRLLRVAARGSKATRLNRLSRIVRVASLMPRLGKMFTRIDTGELDKVLEKKLRRVFRFLDTDMDGKIPLVAAQNVLSRMRGGAIVDKSGAGTKALRHLKRSVTRVAKLTRQGSQGSLSTLKMMRRPSQLFLQQKDSVESPRTDDASEANRVPSDPPVPQDRRASDPEIMQVESEAANAEPSSPTAQDSQSPPRWMTNGSEADSERDARLIDFQEFRSIVLEDDSIAAKLRRACQKEMRTDNNMKNLTSRHSEYVAVKVALGVLVLLFVLSVIEPGVTDFAAQRGLRFCDEVAQQIGNVSAGTPVPQLLEEQVEVWKAGVGEDPARRIVLYLDLHKQVYCNELTSPSLTCTSSPAFSGQRTSLEDVDKDLIASKYRPVDILIVRVPDLDNEDISADELNAQTTSVAVLLDRAAAEYEAEMSMITTVVVIGIILSGITLLTKDLTFLSRNLLKPLRALADDMESVAQLQLAGVSNTEEDDEWNDKETSEIQLIRRTFRNMKKAIKSWGKYVPWPVVQLLLRANVEAKLEVNEMEVSIFFSDIANFTTIVESLPPESSLLLLSRYFNDMSKVIDDHGGVVLEFIGDAIQSIYGAPLPNENHPNAAVEASLLMLASLRRMNQWSKARDLPEVNIRCGVHTGRVLVGNMGFHSRMKYGIVGEDSHIPSKLEELNKTYKTNILISKSTFEKLAPDSFVTRPIDYIYLRQAEGATSELIYEVLPLKRTPKSKAWAHKLVRLTTEAFEAYRRHQFASAQKTFQNVSALMKDWTGGEDGASALMVERCKKLAANPPPEGWDGVWDSYVESSS